MLRCCVQAQSIKAELAAQAAESAGRVGEAVQAEITRAVRASWDDESSQRLRVLIEYCRSSQDVLKSGADGSRPHAAHSVEEHEQRTLASSRQWHQSAPRVYLRE